MKGVINRGETGKAVAVVLTCESALEVSLIHAALDLMAAQAPHTQLADDVAVITAFLDNLKTAEDGEVRSTPPLQLTDKLAVEMIIMTRGMRGL